MYVLYTRWLIRTPISCRSRVCSKNKRSSALDACRVHAERPPTRSPNRTNFARRTKNRYAAAVNRSDVTRDYINYTRANVANRSESHPPAGHRLDRFRSVPFTLIRISAFFSRRPRIRLLGRYVVRLPSPYRVHKRGAATVP